MQDKDKLILILYLNPGKRDHASSVEYFNIVYNHFKNSVDDSVIVLAVPITKGPTRIESVNPKLLKPEEYDSVVELLEEYNDKLTQFVNNYSKN